jgi:hypothetical protein
MLTSLTESVIKFFVNWGLEAAENQVKQIALNNTLVAQHVAGDAAMAAADASSSAAGFGGILANVANAVKAFAGEVGAGVAAFMAPFIGPAAPAAGAAAAAATISIGSLYDSGAWNVPHDMVAGLHGGEVVIPQRGGLASQFRDIAAGGGLGGGAGGNRSMTVAPQVHFHNSPYDDSGFQKLLGGNDAALRKAIDRAIRHGAMSGLRSLRA